MKQPFTAEWLREHNAKLSKTASRTDKIALQATNGSPVKNGKQAIAPRFDAFLALLSAHGLPQPVVEYRFHDVRQFKADYAWPAQKLIIERQGGIWARKDSSDRAKRAHTMPLAILRDYEKSNLAQLAGWTYLQFTPEQLDRGDVIETLKIRLSAGL